MSAVIAQCSNGHKWKADKFASMQVIDYKNVIVRSVLPRECPQCKREWIVTYERNERVP